MFCEQAKKNKCFVPVQKLTDDVICSFLPKDTSLEIDPYSSIEEVFSTSEKNYTSSKESAAEKKPKYNMQTRKLKREWYFTKSLRKNCNDINYADWISSKDDPPPPPLRERNQ